MNVALVHNPRAGTGGISRRAVQAALRRHGYKPRYCPLSRAVSDPSSIPAGEFVVVAGGDGSIRRAATALMGTGRVLAPLPTGTANNITASLGLGTDYESIIAGWAHGRRQWIDLGLAKGPWGKQAFIEGLGFGLLGRAIPVIEKIDEASHHHFPTTEDKLHRDLCVFIALACELGPAQAAISVDGERARRDSFLMMELMNVARSGPRLELVPRADPSDGQFDLVAVQVEERPKLLRALGRHLSYRRPKPVLSRRKVARMRLRLEEGTFRIDDEIVWSAATHKSPLKVTVEMLHRALEILMPGRGR